MIIEKSIDGTLRVTLDNGITTYAKNLDDVSVALAELALCLQIYKYREL